MPSRHRSSARPLPGFPAQTSALGFGKRHADAVIHGVDEAQLVGVSVAGMAKAGAVVHTGPDDGQSQRHIDTGYCIPVPLSLVINEALYL